MRAKAASSERRHGAVHEVLRRRRPSRDFAQGRVVADQVSDFSLLVADVDGDGDLDVMNSAGRAEPAAWYPNDGEGTFGAGRVNAGLEAHGRLAFADVDGDAHVDLVSASRPRERADGKRVAWYRNDGDGRFGPQQLISPLEWGARVIAAGDLDGDGDPDVVTALDADGVNWHRNELSCPPR